jgi:hypothetical protein
MKNELKTNSILSANTMMTLEDCRHFYAEEVRWAADLSSPALVEAYARVPREKYLGPPPWQIGSALARAMSIADLGRMAYRTTEDPRDLYHNVVVAAAFGQGLCQPVVAEIEICPARRARARGNLHRARVWCVSEQRRAGGHSASLCNLIEKVR